MDELSKHIIRRIIADVGAAPGNIGKNGLVDSKLLLTKTIKIKYDDGVKFEHNCFAGKISLEKTTLRGFLVDLSIDDNYEYLFIFRMDTLPIHAAKTIYNDVDFVETYLKVYNDEKSDWRELSLYVKARLLADFERIVSYGFIWEDCSDVDDLYNAAISLIDIR